MYQAGIKNIKLYENYGIDFYHYNPADKQDITHLEGIGSIIVIENKQQPEFKITTVLTKSGKLGFNYELKFLFFGLTLENFNIIDQLRRSKYGWCVDIELYDGTHKYFNTPLFLPGDAEINPTKEMIFEIEMKNPVAALAKPFNYTPGISELIAYRADTTILTADNAIYTADYAL